MIERKNDSQLDPTNPCFYSEENQDTTDSSLKKKASQMLSVQGPAFGHGSDCS